KTMTLHNRDSPKVAQTTVTKTNPVVGEAVVTKVVEKPVLTNVVEKQNVEVVHKPVVKEVHEQKVIELEKQNVVKNINQGTVVEKSTDQTKYEQVGSRDLEDEKLRLAKLKITEAPVVTQQVGKKHEVNAGEVVSEVIRQEHIEHHIQPVVTEIHEKNVVKEVVHPVVRKVQEETIVREVPSSVDNELHMNWEKNMYTAYQKQGDKWNTEIWIKENPKPVGYIPTGFLNQYPAFSQFHHKNIVVGGLPAT
ncbi:hypothetical protein AKO1_014609, partial [Acrasis kona]